MLSGLKRRVTQSSTLLYAARKFVEPYFDTHAAIFDLGLERQGEHSGQFTS